VASRITPAASPLCVPIRQLPGGATIELMTGPWIASAPEGRLSSGGTIHDINRKIVGDLALAERFAPLRALAVKARFQMAALLRALFLAPSNRSSALAQPDSSRQKELHGRLLLSSGNGRR
jgi:hypothetical protein